LHQVGKAHAHGVDANERLAGLGCRLWGVADLENVRRTVPRYDHGAHAIPPVTVPFREFERPVNSNVLGKAFGNRVDTTPVRRNSKPLIRKLVESSKGGSATFNGWFLSAGQRYHPMNPKVMKTTVWLTK